MAAARAVREAGLCAEGDTATAAEAGSSAAQPASHEAPVDDMWSLFPSSSSTKAPVSTFFSILTTHTPENGPPETPSLENMHIAVRGDPTAAVGRVRDAFGPGTESPDDIVLRTRDGRAGTGQSAAAPQPKKGEVRVAKAATTINAASEVDKAHAADKKRPPTKPKTQKSIDSTGGAGKPSAAKNGKKDVGGGNSATLNSRGSDPKPKKHPEPATTTKTKLQHHQHGPGGSGGAPKSKPGGGGPKGQQARGGQ